MNDIEEKIYNILGEVLNVNINDYMYKDLIEEGIIDSLMFIELITVFENEFDIEVNPTQVPSNTWKSILSIRDLILKRINEKNE